jgi:uncharacterized membrane protein YbhN (UPF0104 family)
MSVRLTARIAAGAATVAALVLAGLQLGSSLPSLRQLNHPDLPWLTLALLAELASLLAYALLVRRLLAAGGVTGGTLALLRTTVSGIAMTATLPAGQALSGTYWYRQLRRQDAEPGLAALVLAATTIAGLVSLIGILIVGVGVAGEAGPLADARVPIILAAIVLMALRIALHRRLGNLANNTLCRYAPAARTASRLGNWTMASVAALAYSNWLLDCACLVGALAAMHAHVPAQSILLTYALAQLVASLPLLPGGGGTVEISLVAGFAAFGHGSTETIAGILLYRLISCWGLAPIGGLTLALDRRRTTAVRRRWRPIPDPVQMLTSNGEATPATS